MSTQQTQPGGEHNELGVFLGRWHTTGEVAPAPGETAAKVDATDIYEWYPGGFFLLHHADGMVGENAVRSMEIIGYDAESKSYHTSFFDNTGGYGTEHLTREGNTWTWRGTNVIGVKEHRCIAVVSDDGKAIYARHEKSEDGHNWELWMNVTLSKTE